MANEPLPGLRGDIRAKNSTAAGADPSVAATDAKYIDAWTANAKPRMEARGGMSPRRGGWPNVLTGQDNTWGGTAEIPYVHVLGTDAVTPEIEPWLMACGFANGSDGTIGHEYSAATPNIITYTLMSHGHHTCAIQERKFNPAGTALIGTEYLGCRCDWTIEIDGTGKWVLVMDGAAKTGTAIATAAEDTLTYGFDSGPAISSQTAVTLENLDAAGDGTFAAVVRSATISGNMEMSVNEGLAGTLGAYEVRLNPTGGVGVELLMEQQLDAEWDPAAYMLDQTGLDNSYKLTLIATSSSGTNRTVETSPFFISGNDIEPIPNEGGSRLWRVSYSGIYPEVAADGGGLVPADNFKLLFKSNT